MIEAFAPSDVYAAESALMATLSDGELMARAVEGLVAVTSSRVEQLGARRVVALVGPGNNGADALFATAGLALEGVNCAAVHHGSVHQGALAAAVANGVVVIEDPQQAREVIGEADVVLDGILGIGGRGGLPDWARAWVGAVSDTAYVIAVDVPSGHAPDGSAADPDGVFADETVTFSVCKPVHLLPGAAEACGRLTVVDIGLDVEAEPAVARLTRDDVAALWPVPTALDDKYSRGVVGVMAGSEAYTGAAVLAVTAAAEAGVGMVRYVGPPSAEALVRAAVPEAVHGVGRVQAWVIGPGMDDGSRAAGTKAQVDAAREALEGDLPVVLDAGGLDLVEHGWRRAAPTVLTPHAGECARLLTRLSGVEVTNSAVSDGPLAAARQLSELTGATVLLKGSTTLVVPPEGPVWSQCDAPPWLATAGAGDVLAGLVGTLLAQGVDAPTAAALGALVHGVAADNACPGGPVRALRVAEALPRTVAALLHRA